MNNVITRAVGLIKRIPPLAALIVVAVSSALVFADAKIDQRDERIRREERAQASADSAKAINTLKDSLAAREAAIRAEIQRQADEKAAKSRQEANRAITRWNRLRDSLKLAQAAITPQDGTTVIETADVAIQTCSVALNDCAQARQEAERSLAAERADKERIRAERDKAQADLATPPPEPKESKKSKLLKWGGVIGGLLVVAATIL